MESNWDKLTSQELQKVCDGLIEEAKIKVEVARDLSNEFSNKIKLYFAGPWFDEKSKLLMDTIIEIVDILGDYCKYDVYFPMLHKFNTPYEAFEADTVNMCNADISIVFISQKDIGTAFELGYMYNDMINPKNIGFLTYDETCFDKKTNIMLAYAGNFSIGAKDIVEFFAGNYKVTKAPGFSNDRENME